MTNEACNVPDGAEVMPDELPDEEAEVLREFARTVVACRRIGRVVARVAAFSVPLAALAYYALLIWRNRPHLPVAFHLWGG